MECELRLSALVTLQIHSPKEIFLSDHRDSLLYIQFLRIYPFSISLSIPTTMWWDPYVSILLFFLSPPSFLPPLRSPFAVASAGPLRSARAHPTGGALALADAAVRRTRVQLGARTREQASGHEDLAAAAWRRQPSRRRRTALSARGHPRRVPAPGAARVGQAAAFVHHAAGIWLVFVV